jgi:hypothetical protein
MAFKSRIQSAFASTGLVLLSISSNAQDCDALFLLKPGATIELTRYDATGRMKGGKMVNVVEKAEKQGDEQISRVTSTNYTDEGVSNSSTNLIYICDGKTMRIYTENSAVIDKLGSDLKEMAEGAGGKKFATATIIDPIEYPLTISEGIELQPHQVTSLMSMQITRKELQQVGLTHRTPEYNSAGMQTGVRETRTLMEVLVDRGIATATTIGVRNIRVGAKEAVQVPAGEYQCFKISKELYAQSVGKGELGQLLVKNIGVNMKSPTQTVTEWYAPGIGIVKTEIKDAKGNVLMTLQATKISS